MYALFRKRKYWNSMIYALLTRNFVVRIYAIFPQIFLDWKAKSSDIFTFWMYGHSRLQLQYHCNWKQLTQLAQFNTTTSTQLTQCISHNLCNITGHNLMQLFLLFTHRAYPRPKTSSLAPTRTLYVIMRHYPTHTNWVTTVTHDFLKTILTQLTQISTAPATHTTPADNFK